MLAVSICLCLTTSFLTKHLNSILFQYNQVHPYFSKKFLYSTKNLICGFPSRFYHFLNCVVHVCGFYVFFITKCLVIDIGIASTITIEATVVSTQCPFLLITWIRESSANHRRQYHVTALWVFLCSMFRLYSGKFRFASAFQDCF